MTKKNVGVVVSCGCFGGYLLLVALQLRAYIGVSAGGFLWNEDYSRLERYQYFAQYAVQIASFYPLTLLFRRMRRWKKWGKICAATGVLVLPALLVRLGNACYLDCTLKAVEGQRRLGTFLAYLAFRLLAAVLATLLPVAGAHGLGLMGERPSPGKIDAAPPPPAESGEA
ncbi:MAG: hypothetical protein Q4C31_07005 [Eubacteriales bacterium]|nr:hypothetical protein [Eubacteriales bacterium]